MLGLDLKKDELFSIVSADELIKVLRRIVLDLAEKKVNVTALKKKDQMVAYVVGLDTHDKPDLSNRVSPQSLDQFISAPKASPSVPTGNAPSPRPRSIATPQRHSIVPKPYVLRVVNPKASEIYEELKVLQLTKNRHAISVLFRVFLELSIDHHLFAIGSKTTFMPPNGSRETDKTLKTKIL